MTNTNEDAINKNENKTANNKRTWAQTFAVYRDKRMLKILLLGFVSGLPWLFIASMVSLWLKEEGLSRTGIGLFGLIFSVYAVNALWAPVVEGVSLPFLTRALGRRRAWIVFMQSLIVIALIAIALLPSAAGNLWLLAALLLAIATASATQDIAIDALRIELIKPEETEKIGAGSAMATSGWWLGFGGGKAFAFPLVELLQSYEVMRAWQAGYLAMAVVVILSAIMIVLFIREKDNNKGKDNNEKNVQQNAPALSSQSVWLRVMSTFTCVAISGWLLGFSTEKTLASAATTAIMAVYFSRRAVFLYWLPVRDFILRYGGRAALMLLFFIFFFKIGEAFLGRMSLVFYKEIGFSKSQIGLLSGGLGTVTVCIFAVLGSFINARYGLFRGIVLGGIAMAGTNLLFAALYYHPEEWLFTIAVIADQFTTAVSTVAFVAFLSQLCDRRHTASQYAAFASIGNLSRTTLAASSGALVDGLGGNWSLFFIITVLMVMPSLLILAAARKTLSPIMTGKTTKVI